MIIFMRGLLSLKTTDEEILFDGAVRKPGNYLDTYATTTSIDNEVNKIGMTNEVYANLSAIPSEFSTVC